jgi:ABC-2 type transport system permease protein
MRRNDLIRLVLSISAVLLIAFLLSNFFFKVDLTAEKRHSLTPATREMLGELNENIFIRCYLHGEFPAGFKQLEKSIKERLDEFSDYSGGKLGYEFIDPYESGNKNTINEVFAALDEKGLQFSNITFNQNGAQSSKLIWPAAVVEYKGREYPIQFLKTNMPSPTEAIINNSVNNLEYELANGLRKITRESKPLIGVLTGHREMDALHMADFITGLKENYYLQPVRLDSQINALSDKAKNANLRLNRYEGLIIAKPDSAISDKDRFILDQYIMNGGKVLWLLDALKINMDSLRKSEMVMAVSNENGLYEMLFEYGARLNRSLVIDFQGSPVILDNGPMGNQRAYTERTNYYCPLMLSPNNPHPIMSNLDPVKLEFAGSVDTVNQNPEVFKIPLLYSSELSKELKAPVRVNLELLRFGQEYFRSGNQPNRMMGLIMEGKFPSAFRDHIPTQIKNDPDIAYKEKSLPTKMIVIADGDIAYNYVDFRSATPKPYPLGYDPQFKRVIYDNKEFLLNCMNYLMDDAALISVRSRTIELRQLNAADIQNDRQGIQVANTALPLIVLALIGLIQFFVRKRKWAK